MLKVHLATCPYSSFQLSQFPCSGPYFPISWWFAWWWFFHWCAERKEHVWRLELRLCQNERQSYEVWNKFSWWTLISLVLGGCLLVWQPSVLFFLLLCISSWLRRNLKAKYNKLFFSETKKASFGIILRLLIIGMGCSVLFHFVLFFYLQHTLYLVTMVFWDFFFSL